MDMEFWQKQSSDQPLFGNLLWSRPENKTQAGKLLVVGGNLHGFSAPATAFAEAGKAGVGTCRVVLPDSLQRTVSKLFPEAEFAPSTPVSGGLARKALVELLELSTWSDGVLLAGDFGKNSETSVLLASYLEKYDGQMTLVNDAVDECLNDAANCLNRPDTTLVLTIAQLQKLGIAAKYAKAFTSNMDLLPLIQTLHDFSSQHQANLVIHYADQLIVATGGQISTTKSTHVDAKLTKPATHAAVWWLQTPSRPFEALTTAVLEFQK